MLAKGGVVPLILLLPETAVCDGGFERPDGTEEDEAVFGLEGVGADTELLLCRTGVINGGLGTEELLD